MIDYAYISTLPSLRWIRKKPRQWDFFCWLLDRAGKDGYALVSVREYAANKELPWTTVRDWLKSVTFRPFIEATRMGKLTLVYFRKYESYVRNFAQSSVKVRSPFAQSSPNESPMGEKLEEKFPPAPPIKEEYVSSNDATLKKEEKKAADASSLSSSSPSRPTVSIRERKERFWALCEDAHRRNPEIPREMVETFFDFWTETTLDGLYLKFELEKRWGTDYRLKRWVKQGRFYTDRAQAQLDAILSRGGGKKRQSTSAGVQRQEAEQPEEQRRREQETEAMWRSATTSPSAPRKNYSLENALLDPQYWIRLGVDDPETEAKAKRNPEHYEAYKKACEIVKKKS